MSVAVKNRIVNFCYLNLPLISFSQHVKYWMQLSNLTEGLIRHDENNMYGKILISYKPP